MRIQQLNSIETAYHVSAYLENSGRSDKRFKITGRESFNSKPR